MVDFFSVSGMLFKPRTESHPWLIFPKFPSKIKRSIYAAGSPPKREIPRFIPDTRPMERRRHRPSDRGGPDRERRRLGRPDLSAEKAAHGRLKGRTHRHRAFGR